MLTLNDDLSFLPYGGLLVTPTNTPTCHRLEARHSSRRPTEQLGCLTRSHAPQSTSAYETTLCRRSPLTLDVCYRRPLLGVCHTNGNRLILSYQTLLEHSCGSRISFKHKTRMVCHGASVLRVLQGFLLASHPPPPPRFVSASSLLFLGFAPLSPALAEALLVDQVAVGASPGERLVADFPVGGLQREHESDRTHGAPRHLRTITGSRTRSTHLNLNQSRLSTRTRINVTKRT